MQKPMVILSFCLLALSGSAAGQRDSAVTDSSHLKAVSFANQAGNMKSDSSDVDFVRMERLARESLYWFGRTSNKDKITAAYNALGFALYAQSRFSEAIQYLKQSYSYALKAGNCPEAISTLSLMGYAYRESGDFEKSFDISRQCLQLAEEIKSEAAAKGEYFALAELFMLIEDYTSAEKYFRMAGLTDITAHRKSWGLLRYAELLTRQHKYDSARYYYSLFDTAHAGGSLQRGYLVSKGEYHLLQRQYKEALPYFIQSLSYQRQLNDGNQTMRCLQDLSQAYEGLNEDSAAFRCAREVLSIAEQAKARQYIRDGSQTLYTLYDKKRQTDSAYFYYRRYITMKENILNDQLKGKFASYGFEQQIRFLNQEKHLQDVCLRQEMLTKNVLIGSIVVLLLIGFICFRYIQVRRKNEAFLRQRAENELEIERLEGERAKASLLQRAKELEVQALRSQMNPHFIFNCLNAINYFILNHETEAASDYLTKFSRLMRMIMNHSRHSLITLSEELEVLELYLNMERLRFKDAFDYTIETEDEPDADDISIPPLLLQPFVENAIWHGLMHKEERGLLSIVLRVEDDILTCIIRDNGVGRKRAAALKSKSAEKHKSMGLQITAERMALLTGSGEPGHFFRIDDLYDEFGNAAGTQVVLTIKINSTAGEPVATNLQL
jgi:tetratricopeptide (TPR) repeat protein